MSMNDILSLRKYENMLKGCNDKHIVIQDIESFESDIKELQELIKRAKQEVK